MVLAVTQLRALRVTWDARMSGCVGAVRGVPLHIRLSRDIFLPEILGTEEGIKALSTFLKVTNAFKATGKQTTPKEAPRFEEQPEPPNTDDEDNG